MLNDTSTPFNNVTLIAAYFYACVSILLIKDKNIISPDGTKLYLFSKFCIIRRYLRNCSPESVLSCQYLKKMDVFLDNVAAFWLLTMFIYCMYIYLKMYIIESYNMMFITFQIYDLMNCTISLVWVTWHDEWNWIYNNHLNI